MLAGDLLGQQFTEGRTQVQPHITVSQLTRLLRLAFVRQVQTEQTPDCDAPRPNLPIVDLFPLPVEQPSGFLLISRAGSLDPFFLPGTVYRMYQFLLPRIRNGRDVPLLPLGILPTLSVRADDAEFHLIRLPAAHGLCTGPAHALDELAHHSGYYPFLGCLKRRRANTKHTPNETSAPEEGSGVAICKNHH